MTRSRSLIVAGGLALILGGQVVYTILLAVPDGIRIRSPEAAVPLDRRFVVSGDAWMRHGIDRIEVTAEPIEPSADDTSRFPGSRDTVRYRGAALFALSTWSTRVELPADGRWRISAAAIGTSGEEVRTSSRMLEVRAGTFPREFRSWTAEHLVPVAVILLASVVLGLLARTDRRRLPLLGLVLSLVLWANEFVYQLYWFRIGGWSPATALMLQMCGLSILLLPVMFFSENPRVRQFLFDVLYFWGIGGALQALIAPDIGSSGFPSYRYFSFFLSHGLIIALTALMAMAGGMRITLRSFLRALIVTNILLVPVYGIDQLLRLIPPYDAGNYFVLAYPPPTGSIVDLFADIFGPSPRYVAGLELMGVAVFGLLYLPWPVTRLLGSRRPKGRARD